jgi:hypothetical protein
MEKVPTLGTFGTYVPKLHSFTPQEIVIFIPFYVGYLPCGKDVENLEKPQ